ncbi:uncharacterized protein T551_01430, partial [Pneumocystis jirovecii RU7]
HSLARAVARAVKRGAAAAQGTSVYDDEDNFLALILKDKLEGTECQKKLKEYCENLKETDKELNKVYPKLKDICKDKDKKCTDLKAKITGKTGKCTTLKTTLDTIVKNSLPSDDDCKENERQCLFLEGACPGDLTENCNKLRNKCYQKKRDEVAEKVILRTLRGTLEDKNGCKKELKKICLELAQESNELMKLCLYQESTCEKFVSKRKEKCNALKQDVEKALNNKNDLEGKCLLLLERCYFYRGDCKDIQKCDKSSKSVCIGYVPDCDDLGVECEKKNITYVPPGRGFDPTEPEVTIAEDIGLKELYKEATERGVYIGKSYARDTITLLGLLIQDESFKTQPNEVEKCKKVLETKCKELKEHEVLGYLCNKDVASKNGTDECNALGEELSKRRLIVSEKIKNKHLFKSRKIIPWYNLSTFLSNSDCARLESDCFYFAQDQSPLNKECDNLKAACYKRGLDARANKVLQKEMYGLFYGSGEAWFKKLLDKVMKQCAKHKTASDELFLLCVEPLKAVRILATDVQMRAIFLQEELDKRRDFPTKKDCKELEEKCKTLGKDSKKIEWPCRTLEQNCDRLRATEKLKHFLLNEHKDSLKTPDNCIQYLNKKCHEWPRKGNNHFSLVCVFLESTCKIIVEDIKDRCKILENNIKISNVTGFLEDNRKNIELLGRDCPFWNSYCNRFSPNCLDFKEGAAFCIKLKDYCKPFYERKLLEDALKVELRGKLNDEEKCNPELKRYCTVLKNVNNASINGLCKNDTDSKPKNDEDVRKKLCKKLVKEIEEQCKTLPAELKQPADDLEKDSKTYEKLKKEAKDAMNNSNLILSLVKKNESNISKNNSKSKDKKNVVSNGLQDTTEHVKILRRGVKDVSVTESEAKAFDLVAEVFGRYLDLKERCNKLESDCGIKKDCKALENVCEKIQEVCSKLKPLKVKPHEIVTESTTTTTTTTTTVTDPKATECKSLQTTDTWVTQTSTHTSTSTITSTITSKITLTSTRRCKPTKCTTGDDAEDVKPNEGLKMSGWSVMRGVILAMMISIMI